MRKLFVALPVLLIAGFLSFSDLQAKCGVNSVSTQRCEEGGWRTVVTCHDGVERTMARGHSSGGPEGCFGGRRYSASRQEIRDFCATRCRPARLDCSEEPSFEGLTRAICERIVTCRPDVFMSHACQVGMSETECSEFVFGAKMIECLSRLNGVPASDELGLAESSGEITFAVIRDALTAGTIRFDNAVYCDCIYRMRGNPDGGPIPSCPAFHSGEELEEFGEQVVEELIPEQCGNDAFPGVLLPDGFNPVTGAFE